MRTIRLLPRGNRGILVPDGEMFNIANQTDWLPTAISTLACWYKADSLDLADGADVTSWADSSGNSRTLTQSGSADLCPHYTINSINGYPAVLFDGTNDYMVTAAFALSQPEHVFIVCKQVSSANTETIFDGLTANKGKIHQHTNAGEIRAYAGGTGIPIALDPNSTTGFSLIEVVFNGATSRTTIANTPTLTGNAGSNNLDGITLGAAGGNTLYSNVLIAEVIVFSSELKNNSLQQVRNYLKTKYALDVRENNLISSPYSLAIYTGGSGLTTHGWSIPAGGGRVTRGSTAIITPDGKTSTTCEIIEDGSQDNTHYIVHTSQKLPASKRVYTEVYFHQGNTSVVARWPSLVFHSSPYWEGIYTNVALDPSDGTLHVTEGHSLVDYGVEEADHGWYKVWAACDTHSTKTATDNGFDVLIGLADSATGDIQNVDGNSTSSIHIWGCKQQIIGDAE